MVLWVSWIVDVGEFYGTNASPHVMSLFKLSVINGEVPSKINFDYLLKWILIDCGFTVLLKEYSPVSNCRGV